MKIDGALPLIEKPDHTDFYFNNISTVAIIIWTKVLLRFHLSKDRCNKKVLTIVQITA
jgi:hypothetical protein